MPQNLFLSSNPVPYAHQTHSKMRHFSVRQTHGAFELSARDTQLVMRMHRCTQPMLILTFEECCLTCFMEVQSQSRPSGLLSSGHDWHELASKLDTIGMQVTMQDFETALAEVKPAFGAVLDTLETYRANGIIPYGERFVHLQSTCRTLVEQARHFCMTVMLRALIVSEPAGLIICLATVSNLQCHSCPALSRAPEWFTCQHGMQEGIIALRHTEFTRVWFRFQFKSES